MQVLHNIDYIGAFSNRYNVKLLLPKSVLEEAIKLNHKIGETVNKKLIKLRKYSTPQF